MTDTDTFCFAASTTSTTKTKANNLKSLDSRYLSKTHCVDVKSSALPLLQTQTTASSSYFFGVIHKLPTTTAMSTTKLLQAQQQMSAKQKPTTGKTLNSQAAHNNKDFVNMLQEQLKLLTTDLPPLPSPENYHQYLPRETQPKSSSPPYLDSQPFFDYVDKMNYQDHDPEHLMPGLPYFTEPGRQLKSKLVEKGMSSASSTTAKANGFLPSAFNSIRNLVGNVIRFPSFLLDTLNDLTFNSPDPTDRTENGEEQRSGERSFREPYFDVNDFDFMPDMEEDRYFAAEDTSPNECYAEGETSKWLDPHCLYESCSISQTVGSSSSSRLLDNCDGSIENKTTFEQGVSQCDWVNKEDQRLDNVTNTSTTTTTTSSPNATSNATTSPMDIAPAINKIHEPCIRRFVCTPDQVEQEPRSMVTARRKRHSVPVKMALVSRSTPIAVKTNCQRSRPRILIKRSLTKNRKEKRRHEIATNIHEDYALSSDSEVDRGLGVDEDAEEVEEHGTKGQQQMGASESCWQTVTDDTEEDDELLPLTARNLREPSCLVEFCGETSASLNSSGGSLSRSVPRRNSINFQATMYERDFPTIGGGAGVRDEERDGLAQALVVTKRNSVYFEIPNSPQRRRMIGGGAPGRGKMLLKPKQRTNSVMSSSVGSLSPATSFEAGGKFWGERRAGRRERTVSECSDDDLIEFVAEDGTTTDQYLSDMFSESDEDYTSEEETSESESDEEFEEDNEADECDTDEQRISRVNVGELMESSRQDDLPDSGLEEKRVRFGTKPQVRMLCTWDYAHRQARKGHWEEVGRDRVRFADRIRRLEAELKPILGTQHRDKVYNQRFAEEAPIR